MLCESLPAPALRLAAPAPEAPHAARASTSCAIRPTSRDSRKGFTIHGDGATWLYSTGAGDEGSDGAPSVTPCVCHCLEGIEGTDNGARVRALKDWVLRTGGFLCVGGGFLSAGASFPLSSSFSCCVVIALELELESGSGFSLTVSRLPRKRARI